MKTAALGAIAGAGAGALGMMQGQSAQASSAHDSKDASWDEEFDLVIVGAGMAGQAAAVTVALEGKGAKCLLAEKLETPQGNTPFSVGSILYGEDVEAFHAYMLEMAGEHANTPEDVIRVFSEGCCSVKEWIFGTLGADWETSGTQEPPANKTDENKSAEYPEHEHSWAVGKIRIGKGDGAPADGPKHLIHVLTEHIKNNPDTIEFRTEAPMTELIRNWETGRVEGAVIGGKRIKATKGVIMCCGGFETDPNMLENYLGQYNAVPGAGIGNTGDGHRACMKIGADFWHMSHVAGFWMAGRDLENTRSTTIPAHADPTKPLGITVGINGRRFYMDSDSYHSRFTKEYGADLRLSVGSRHGHMNLGGEWPHGQMPSKGWFIFDQKALEAGAVNPDLSTDPVADGLVYKAETIAELAELIDVPSSELEHTVEVWNGYCEQGSDDAFYRPESTLNPVATGPFYAQLCVPSFLNTDGGPVRDAKARILDPDGNPIPGLFSAGEFGSIWCGQYNGGGNLSEGVVFGQIAVRTALSE